MKKVILSPAEILDLKPHKSYLDEPKLKRLAVMMSRQSPFDKKTNVMSSPPIVITPNGYIVNGVHRSVMSVIKELSLEACVIERLNDLRYHLPSCCLGELGVEKLFDCYQNADMYYRYAKMEGAPTIRGLIQLQYAQIAQHFPWLSLDSYRHRELEPISEPEPVYWLQPRPEYALQLVG